MAIKHWQITLVVIIILSWPNTRSVIWKPGPYGAEESGDIVGLKCHVLISASSPHCGLTTGLSFDPMLKGLSFDPMLRPAGVISHLPARIWQCCAQGFAKKKVIILAIPRSHRAMFIPDPARNAGKVAFKCNAPINVSPRCGVAGLPQGIRQFWKIGV